MNILQIISGRGVNGALVYCKILSEQLADRGHNVTLVCRPGSWMIENIDASKVEIFESSLSRFPFSEFRRVVNMVRRNSIDIIHTHMTRGQNFGIGLKWLTGLPVVATAHNRNFEFHWNFNDHVIANSNSTYNYHRRFNRIPVQKLSEIYCCPDFTRLKLPQKTASDSIRNQLRIPRNENLGLVIGEVSDRKGQYDLVRALPLIRQSIPNFTVAFIGRYGDKQAYTQKIHNFLARNNLEDAVRWLGRKSQISEYMEAAQIVVMPSTEEPLGLVAVESLFLGKPIVASDTGGLREIVKDGVTGLLVRPRDHQSIADAVVQLLSDRELQSRLITAGKQYVSNTFGTEHLIDQVIEVYDRIARPIRAA